jgi:hypothetical protein
MSMKRILSLGVAGVAALVSSACVVVPARPRYVEPAVVYTAPAPPPSGVVYVQPAYAMPAPGYAWVYHPRYGWGWHHPHHGWHQGWR